MIHRVELEVPLHLLRWPLRWPLLRWDTPLRSSLRYVFCFSPALLPHSAFVVPVGEWAAAAACAVLWVLGLVGAPAYVRWSWLPSLVPRPRMWEGSTLSPTLALAPYTQSTANPHCGATLLAHGGVCVARVT